MAVTLAETDATTTGATPRRVLITVCVMMAALMQTLDSTIANVALPYMQGSMAANQEEDQLGSDQLYRGGRDHDGAAWWRRLWCC